MTKKKEEQKEAIVRTNSPMSFNQSRPVEGESFEDIGYGDEE